MTVAQLAAQLFLLAQDGHSEDDVYLEAEGQYANITDVYKDSLFNANVVILA